MTQQERIFKKKYFITPHTFHVQPVTWLKYTSRAGYYNKGPYISRLPRARDIQSGVTVSAHPRFRIRHTSTSPEKRRQGNPNRERWPRKSPDTASLVGGRVARERRRTSRLPSTRRDPGPEPRGNLPTAAHGRIPPWRTYSRTYLRSGAEAEIPRPFR